MEKKSKIWVAIAILAIAGMVVYASGVNVIGFDKEEKKDMGDKVDKEKPDKVGFGGKVSVYIQGKEHKDKNATARVGEKIEAKVNGTAINVTDAEIGGKINATNINMTE